MGTRLFGQREWPTVWLVTCSILMTTSPAFAQATSTFNGRVVDQSDAVLPGVTVTATNASTGVVRSAVTNAEGVYSLPGLSPGVYDITTDLPGFVTAKRPAVTLSLNSTITIDFRLAVAGVEETVTVTGDAPLIEVTQSKVASTIETTELQNLPMITRTVSGMLALLPGAAPAAPSHRSKENVGSVSFAGGSGTNTTTTVDGADNKDYRYSGPLLSYTTESLENFQLATQRFSAADGRTGGAALTMVTKSGTNAVHGSAFLFARDEGLMVKDYFTRVANRDKIPFDRQQFGGSIGGPIVRNRMFFFGAIEQALEDVSVPVPENLFREKQLLVQAAAAGLLSADLVNPNHPQAGPRPMRLRMYTVKTDAQLNNSHSLMARFAGQVDERDGVVFNVSNDNREPENSKIRMWSAVAQHNWVTTSGLNQLTGQVNHLYRLSDVTNAKGDHYRRDYPNVSLYPPALDFPSVSTGAGRGGSLTNNYIIEIKDEMSLQSGTHALRFGADYNYLPDLGLTDTNAHMPTFSFFDDPSVILSNSNGRYPQGFRTPGIVESWSQANPKVLAQEILFDAQRFGTWFQDDWRVRPQLTMNLGIRYDLDINFFGQRDYKNNATRLALEAIGHRYGALPKTPTKNISPRVGFAYDLSGDGRRVLRGGYGIYFDQIVSGGFGDALAQNHRPLSVPTELLNTAIGVGDLATYRFGLDPVPPPPTAEVSTLPPGSTGRWLDPDLANPYNHQAHVGYAHELAANTTFSLDVTHVEGRNELRTLNINPLVNRQRVLAPDFRRVFGIPDVLNQISVLSSVSESQYDAMIVRLQRRLPRATLQAHYTLARAYAYGGRTGNRSGAAAPQDSFDPLAPGEWGPTENDERHRLVAMGVFELPYGIQFSPIFQAATARPYNLTAGRDLNQDGTNNDRYIDPATGQQVSVNSARGDNTTLLDIRTTKFFELGGDRRLGVFAEFFNVLNTVNFGNSYTGNGRSATFRQPTGFIGGVGYERQVQLGARFIF